MIHITREKELRRLKGRQEMMTNCDNCSAEIDENEVQKCKLCGHDGLGNCCIGDLDHSCAAED